MATMVSPATVRAETASLPGARTTGFTSSLSPNGGAYYVTEAAGRVWEWNDFDPTDSQFTEHSSYNAAVESIIAGCEALYLEFHDLDACVVTRDYDGDGRIIGFRLSRDGDGEQHGDDEHFTSAVWNW